MYRSRLCLDSSWVSRGSWRMEDASFATRGGFLNDKTLSFVPGKSWMMRLSFATRVV